MAPLRTHWWRYLIVAFFAPLIPGVPALLLAAVSMNTISMALFMAALCSIPVVWALGPIIIYAFERAKVGGILPYVVAGAIFGPTAGIIVICLEPRIITGLLIAAGFVGLFYGSVVGACLGALANRVISQRP